MLSAFKSIEEKGGKKNDKITNVVMKEKFKIGSTQRLCCGHRPGGAGHPNQIPFQKKQLRVISDHYKKDVTLDPEG